MRKSTWKNRIQVSLGIILTIGLWQLLAIKIDNSIYLPKISEVLDTLISIVREEDFVKIVISTLNRTFISFVIAIILGVIMGIISSISPLINNLLKPINIIGKTIPTLVLVVLALIWFNKESAPFIVGIAIVFPIVYDGILNVLLDNDKKMSDMMKIYEVNILDKIVNIYLPMISFYLIKILVPTFSLAFKVVIAGEVHGQPKYGIGAAVQIEKINFNTPGIFAWIIIIGIISIIFDFINKILTGRFYRWHEDV